MANDHNFFKVFASNLEQRLAQYPIDEERTLLETQRNQIKTLIGLEKKLKQTLIKHQWGPRVYKKFIEFICDDKRNILAARPYFRERQTEFTKYISPALKKRNFKTLYKFRVNYTFVLFALKCFKWPPGGKVQKLANEIEKLRRQMTEQNLPLAISQARMFYACTPKSHLTWMDLVQIHCGGLLIAVDKFVPPDTSNMSNEESLQAYRKFRAVAIGRMISDRLESASETVLHFYPVDRKKLYRAHKLIKQFNGNIDYVQLAEMVNNGIELASQRTTPEEIANLLSSASTVSGDTAVDDTMETTLERFPGALEDRYDKVLENADALVMMKRSIQDLSMIQKKILRMQGIQIYENVEQNGSCGSVPYQIH